MVLLLNLAGGPARALTRSGSMSWNFNDITTRDPSGRGRFSSWGQAYGLNLSGNLLHPYLGTFAAGGEYSEGSNINSTVNTGATGQRVIGGNASLDLFHHDVRRYVRFAPNYSVQSTKYLGSPESRYTNNFWGYSTGLSLPRLPAINANRQYNRIKNAFGDVSTDQRQTLMSEDLSYQLRGLRLRLNQERQRTEDPGAVLPSPLATTQRGSLDYGLSNLKRLRLQYLTLHTEYLRFATDGATKSKSLSNFVSLRTNDVRAGAWKHSLNYTNDSRRDLLRRTHDMSHSMLITSSRPVRRGNFVNSTAAGASGRGLATRRASVSPYLSLAFREGKLLTAFNGFAGWSRSASGAASLGDSLGTRLDLRPRKTLNFFADLNTNESIPLTADAPAGHRSSRAGLGGTRRYGGGETTLRYDHARDRSYATGGGSDSDQVNLNASATPAPRLNTSLGASFSETRTTEGTVYDSKHLTGALTYATLWGLSLNADASFAAIEQYTTTAGLTYAMGKTSLALKYTYTATPLPSSFSHISVTLSRTL
ncbi:MAG: hypothetical protein HYV14_13070 [Elusimicrobia bacterium]|nr:hypothetical protein [Elusimicrobiota bacterium]